MASLVLTVLGDDRPGLVDALSAVIDEHGGNWEESRMANLAGKFAGILRVQVADAKAPALCAALDALETGGLLHVTTEQSRPDAQSGASPEPALAARTVRLSLVGQDHPGIVHDIAHALAQRQISIEQLESETESASMAGGVLFRAELTLSVPAACASDSLQQVLEGLANELMVDIEIAQEQ